MNFLEKNRNHPENLELKLKLRNTKSSIIDGFAHKIAQEETKKTNCLECGRCCKALQPPFTEEDKRAINNNEFPTFDINSILINDPKSGVQYLRKSPCPFLNEKACTIYQNRPAACADYPHLHHQHFKYRINSIMDNYEICPIVYNTIERLKTALEVC